MIRSRFIIKTLSTDLSVCAQRNSLGVHWSC
jgi:hypothetical protein